MTNSSRPRNGSSEDIGPLVGVVVLAACFLVATAVVFFLIRLLGIRMRLALKLAVAIVLGILALLIVSTLR